MSERHIIYVLLAVVLGMLAFVPTLFLADTVFGGLLVGAVTALVLWLKGRKATS